MERYIKMICHISCKPQRGFSLVELSVVLVVVGLLLSMAYIVVSKRVGIDLRAKSQQLIQDLNQSLVGFALQHYRLPCPDKNGNGVEQCGTITGEFPWKTVGLTFKPVGATNIPLRYGAYQNVAANLVQASNVFSPILPAQNASSPPVAVTSAVLVNIDAVVSLAAAVADVATVNLLVAQVKLLPAPMINHVRQADQLGVYGW